MTQFIKYILRLVCAVLISISISLPVSITVFPAHSGNLVELHNRMVWIGIGSFHAIVDSVSAAEPDDLDGNGKPDGSRILVSQRRALVRIPLDPKPLLSTAIAPAPDVHPFIQTPLAYSHPEISRYQDSELVLTLHTGVSPPAVFFPSLNS